ncbi:hypothetical protein [Paracoccus sp. PAR01]|uniref:hypothetical protein n=1 Tax=Paracoccus sp. PAR01 TaxID=2769282 RepID=UPI001783516F|nr:hypothetical protein [Paracoccus sp. PAR01]MBD9529489.1 hypothetical protein [Paracoccus sp. PAR01]
MMPTYDMLRCGAFHTSWFTPRGDSEMDASHIDEPTATKASTKAPVVTEPEQLEFDLSFGGLTHKTRINGLAKITVAIVWFLHVLARIVTTIFGDPDAPFGSFHRTFVCGGHSLAKTPVTCALSGLAPRVRTPVFAGGVQDTEHVPLGLLAAGQGGGGHHGRLYPLHFKISRDPTLMICAAVA